MKILIVHNFYQQPGGEDAVVRAELELLKQHGEDVSLYSVHNDDIAGLWPKIRTMATVAYNPQARRDLATRLQADRPDIVHVHNFFPLLSPAIFSACADAGVPCVMTLHNFRILCPTAVLFHDGHVVERSLHHSSWWTVPKKVYRNSLLGTLAVAAMVESHKRLGTWNRAVDRYIVLTPFAKSKFVEGGLPEDRIVVKGNSVAATAGPKSSDPRHGALYVGRLSEEKGLRTLIEAWKSLDYPLKIVGAGPMRDWIAQNAPKNVTLAGYLSRDDVHAEMRKASFLVFPSVCHEMFPVTPIDAFVCGLPVVASHIGSLQGVVEDHLTGLYFAMGDANDLVAKARWAITHTLEMQKFGRAGEKKWAESYTPEINYRDLMTIYRDVIGKRAVARK